jgi:hypothetical protein
VGVFDFGRDWGFVFRFCQENFQFGLLRGLFGSLSSEVCSRMNDAKCLLRSRLFLLDV